MSDSNILFSTDCIFRSLEIFAITTFLDFEENNFQSDVLA